MMPFLSQCSLKCADLRFQARMLVSGADSGVQSYFFHNFPYFFAVF